MDNDKKDGVIVPEEGTPQEQPLTAEDLRSAGLSDEEISSAEKSGFITKPEEKDKKDEGKKKEEEGKQDEEEDDKGGKKEGDDQPDPDEELDPEKETELLSKYNRNEKALYHSQKKERRKRQNAEAARDQVALQNKLNEKRIAELEAERDRLLKQDTERSRKKADDIDEEIEDLEEGAEGKKKEETDPKKKPLTMEDLERMKKEERDEAEKNQKLIADKQKKAKDALAVFNEDAKVRYEDFDDVLENTHQIVEKAVRGQLGTLFKDPRQISKVERKVKEFLLAVANADEFDEKEFNPADFAYELGKLHPSSGRKSDPDADGEEGKGKRGGTLTPEQMRRAERNADRRQPSGSVGGGGNGRKPTSYEDLTPEQAARLPQSEWNKIPKKERDRLLQEA